MRIRSIVSAGAIAIAMLSVTGGGYSGAALAQDQAAPPNAGAPAAQAPEPLDADEMEMLVARIALYPDELVALISGAALYPLQIVEAERYLEAYAKDKSLKPKAGWDGSVISLLNYPEVVKMMSEDLEWTQTFGEAIAYQQKDVLVSIQQLRDEALAKGIIKSDDKVTVIQQNDNVIIQPANTERVYVPRYEPEMLYSANYPITPVSYYADPYPPYWYPGATFFAGAVTGAIWAAAVDWDDWGVWGGRWNGDADFNCNNCFNNRNFSGKVNFNDVDWRNVDRSKINMDRNQLARLDQSNIRNDARANVRATADNSIGNRAANIRNERTGNLPARAGGANRDVRKSTLEGLQSRPGNAANARSTATRGPDVRQNAQRAGTGGSKPAVRKGAQVNRPVGKQRPASRVDNRPRQPSSLGQVNRGRVSTMQSNRGRQSMGGGGRGGGGAVRRGGGGGGGRRR